MGDAGVVAVVCFADVFERDRVAVVRNRELSDASIEQRGTVVSNPARVA